MDIRLYIALRALWIAAFIALTGCTGLDPKPYPEYLNSFVRYDGIKHSWDREVASLGANH